MQCIVCMSKALLFYIAKRSVYREHKLYPHSANFRALTSLACLISVFVDLQLDATIAVIPSINAKEVKFNCRRVFSPPPFSQGMFERSSGEPS